MNNEQKVHFNSPSRRVVKQMTKAGFKIGIPEKAGWYLVAVRTNDISEYYYVLQLWFNPMSVQKWWTGGGYVSDKSEPYRFSGQVRAYSELPSFK